MNNGGQQQKLSVELVEMYNCLWVYNGERWRELTVLLFFCFVVRLGRRMYADLIYAISRCIKFMMYQSYDVSNLCEEKKSNTVLSSNKTCYFGQNLSAAGQNLREFF